MFMVNRVTWTLTGQVGYILRMWHLYWRFEGKYENFMLCTFSDRWILIFISSMVVGNIMWVVGEISFNRLVTVVVACNRFEWRRGWMLVFRIFEVAAWYLYLLSWSILCTLRPTMANHRGGQNCWMSMLSVVWVLQLPKGMVCMPTFCSSFASVALV